MVDDSMEQLYVQQLEFFDEEYSSSSFYITKTFYKLIWQSCYIDITQIIVKIYYLDHGWCKGHNLILNAGSLYPSRF